MSFSKTKIFSILATCVLFASAAPVFAAVYAPGETLNPSCQPTDTNCTVDVTIFSSGLAVGTTTPSSTTNRLYNTSSVLYWNGSQLSGIVGGIISLNGLSTTTQTFATGTSGTDFGIISSGSTHIFNIPTASPTARGLLSSTDWSTFNNKLTSTLNSAQIFVGNASNTATGVALSGDATLSNAGVLTLANAGVSAATYGSTTTIPVITVDAKGRITLAASTSTPFTVSGAIANADVSASAAIALSKLASGSSIVTSLAAPTGSNANGGSIASNVLTLSFADGTNPGLVSTGTQTFAGAKTFSGATTTISNNLTVGSNVLVVDTTNKRVGIGIAAPIADLHIHGAAAQAKVILSGRASDGSGIGDTNGISFGLSHNAANNRQVLFTASDLPSNTTSAAVRILNSGTQAQIDSVSTDGSTQLQLVVGNTGAGVYLSGPINVANTLSIGSLSGLLYGTAGSVGTIATSSLGIAISDTAGTLAIARGGTGTSTAPSSGQLLVGNASGSYTLMATSSLGLLSAAVTAIGPAGQTQSGPTVTFATSTSGSDVSITGSGNVLTWNMPTASASARGLLSSADWSTFNNKLTSTLASGNIFVGNGSNVATAVALSGDATIANTGALTLANSGVASGSYGSTTVIPVVTVDVKGRITSVATTSASGIVIAGDVSGTLASSSVDKIKSTALSITSLANSNLLQFNGTNWVNVTPASLGSIALSLGTSGTDASVSGSPASLGGTLTLNLPTAFSTVRGLLSSADWSTFNNKENTITASTTGTYFRGDKTFRTLDTSAVTENANLYYTDARVRGALSATGPLTYSSGTGAFGVNQASSSAGGYLSSTDWNTFNNKLGTTLSSGLVWVGNGSNVATAVALSGDATLANTGVLTLANSGATAATYGSTTTIPVITVDAKGRITLAASTSTPFTVSGAIANADVSASAAIALSKLASGSSIVTSLAAPTGSNANGGSIASNVLTLSFADGTNPGLVSTGTQTFAGNKTFNATTTMNSGLVVGTTSLVVDTTNGRVGIGTASPASDLQINGVGAQAKLRISGRASDGSGIGDAQGMFFGLSHNAAGNRQMMFTASDLPSNATSAAVRIVNSGTQTQLDAVSTDGSTQLQLVVGNTGAGLYLAGPLVFANLTSCGGLQTSAGGSVSCTSDARLKDSTGVFSDGLSGIMKITPQNYSWKQGTNMYDGGVIHHGFIAQDVQKGIPEAVNERKDGYLQINHLAITAATVNAIKEQQLQVAGIMGADALAFADNPTAVFASTTSVDAAVVANADTGLLSDIGEFLKERIASGIKIVTNLVAERVTAVQGYFKRIFANELCLTDSSGAVVCVTGDQLKNIGGPPAASTSNGSNSPTTSSAAPQATNISSSIATNTSTSTTTANTSTTTVSTTTGSNSIAQIANANATSTSTAVASNATTTSNSVNETNSTSSTTTSTSSAQTSGIESGVTATMGNTTTTSTTTGNGATQTTDANVTSTSTSVTSPTTTVNTSVSSGTAGAAVTGSAVGSGSVQ